MDATTRAKILACQKRTPRFLVRTFAASSGGHASLNTPASITPKAFTRHPIPSSNIFDYHTADLRENFLKHIRNQQDFDTLVSSWSQDLDYIQMFIADCEDDTAHLAIMDTKEVGNTVVHAVEIGGALNAEDMYGAAEFLAFGPVSGPGYKAVPMRELDKLGFERIVLGEERPDWRGVIANVKAIGECFGSKFEAAIAAYLMGQLVGPFSDELGEIVESLWPVHIPGDWSDDPMLKGGDMAIYGCDSCLTAYEILKRLIEKAETTTVGGTRRPVGQGANP